MFDQSTPRLFGVPPGVDFPRSLISGLEQRLISAAPTDWARVRILVNTQRMKRRMRAIFDVGPPRLLPRIDLITELADDPAMPVLPPAVPGLRRRLDLMRLVDRLLQQNPDLAPRAALFDLSDRLAALMDGSVVTWF